MGGTKFNEDIHREIVDILVIDDAFDITEYLSDFFESQGFSLEAVFNGTKGLEILDKIMPKVILLDVLLPDMNGFDIFKEIRNKKEYTKIPIYFITTFPEYYVSEECEKQELNPAGIILEPYNNSSFKEVIRFLKNKL